MMLVTRNKDVTRNGFFWFGCLLAGLSSPLLPARAAEQKGETPIDYNRDIRPILSDNCYACHGPDENKVKAGLRLDRPEHAFKELDGGGFAIVAGKSAESKLIERITTTDESDRMPPAKTGKTLTPAQIETLRKWIDQGAQWKEHWSFITPVHSPLPPINDVTWPRNAIDHFVLNKIEETGLQPSFEADKVTLIRRLTLDLTGLPPTIADVDAFVNDQSPDAYEKLVDRILASPHFGERMAQDWLDLARYGDTNGYHYDSDRSMWPYRDYVINAFNTNKPFDQFTIEQIAGDLLPDATIDQKIASGFNRNVTYNEEGGADPDEFLVKYAVDRASTTGTVFMGLTLGCAECHDHKYDPVSQKEFYQFYSFFNNIPEDGAQGHDQPHPPILKVPRKEQLQKLEEVRALLVAAENELKERPKQVSDAQSQWEKQAKAQLAESKINQGLVAHYEMDAKDDLRIVDSSGHYRHGVYQGGKPNWVPGKAGQALKFEAQSHFVDLDQVGDFERTDAFSYGAWVKAAGSGGVVLAKMDESQGHRGYDFGVVGNKVWVHLINTFPANAIKVTTKEDIQPDMWHHVMVTYDGSSKAAGVKVYVDGKLKEVEVNNDTLTESIKTSVALYIGQRHTTIPFNGLVDDIRIYNRFLTAAEVADLTGLASIHAILTTNAKYRTAEEAQQLQNHYLENVDPEYSKMKEKVAGLQKQEKDVDASIPTTLVMSEMPERRPAFVLVRGNFQNQGEKVEPDVPSIFPRLPQEQPRTRLTLAHWLTDPKHPLVARVTVNRFWKQFFGIGLVKTAEDFGSQGEPPSHPQLLDWLATEFIANKWDVKGLIKTIVTSSTYRQSSKVKDNHSEQDPYNRLLYRGPRFRLSAEQVRDNALSVSGLIDLRLGGPSVNPYQPEGYYGDKGRWKWNVSSGPDQYRRGLYTFWRRTTFYPSFQIFDAPSREACTVDRPRTNTPLQALVTLNDPVYVEAARVFGQRIIQQGGATPEERIRFAFRTALAREPREPEAAVLKQMYEQQHQKFTQEPEAAKKLIAHGQAPRPPELDTTELAAWTACANVLLNLDETITRE